MNYFAFKPTPPPPQIKYIHAENKYIFTYPHEPIHACLHRLFNTPCDRKHKFGRVDTRKIFTSRCKRVECLNWSRFGLGPDSDPNSRGPGARSWFVFRHTPGPARSHFCLRVSCPEEILVLLPHLCFFCFCDHRVGFENEIFFFLLLPFRSWTLFVLSWKVMTFFVLFLSVKRERDYDRWRKLRSVSGGQIYGQRLLWSEVNEFEFLDIRFRL